MRTLGVVLVCASFAWADTISFSDSTFVDANWTAQIALDSTGGAFTFTSGQHLSFGNPATSRLTSHLTSSSPAQVAAGHFQVGASYDPSLGSMLSLDFSIDAYVSQATPNAVGYGLAVRQAGVVYVFFDTGSSIPDDQTWRTVTSTGVTATDLSALNGTGNPDFSGSGGVMEFGYFTSNGASGSTPIQSLSYADNWSVTITTEDTGGGTDPVPEPGTYALFGGALIAYGLSRRRKTA